MSVPHSVINEIQELILTIDAGESTEDECRRLAALLEQHPEATKEVAELLDQQVALADAGRSQLKKTPSLTLPAGIAATHCTQNNLLGKQRPSRWRLLPAIAACLLLTHLAAVGVTWFTLGHAERAANLQVASNAPPPDFVKNATDGQLLSAAPRLIAMTGCVWDEEETIDPRVGKKIEEGEVLHLHEGIVAFELGQSDSQAQAKIRVEGPARLFVRHDGLLELSFGTLTADVSWRGGAFAVVTSEGKVAVPESASIGVVASKGRSEVHVFDGQVEISSSWPPVNDARTLLEAGEAAAILGDHSGGPTVVRFEVSPAAFASSRSMAFDQLTFGTAYRQAVLAAKPAVYWRFEDGDDTVENEGQLQEFAGYVGGSVSWYSTLENRSLEFGLTETAGLFASREEWPHQPLDEYTVQFWVKPSHYHKGTVFGLVGEALPDARRPHSLLIELGGPYEPNNEAVGPNALRFVHRSRMSTEGGTSCSSVTTYSIREWQQIVARKQGSHLELYCNGEVVASAEADGPLPSGTLVLIGQLYPMITKTSRGIEHRPYIGQIDEVALYERALSDQEIRRHYELAKPAPPKRNSI